MRASTVPPGVDPEEWAAMSRQERWAWAMARMDKPVRNWPKQQPQQAIRTICGVPMELPVFTPTVPEKPALPLAITMFTVAISTAQPWEGWEGFWAKAKWTSKQEFHFTEALLLAQEFARRAKKDLVAIPEIWGQGVQFYKLVDQRNPDAPAEMLLLEPRDTTVWA